MLVALEQVLFSRPLMHYIVYQDGAMAGQPRWIDLALTGITIVIIHWLYGFVMRVRKRQQARSKNVA